MYKTEKKGCSIGYFDTIYADHSLPQRAKTVYMYLHDRSGTAGNCWPGIRTIAADLHVSRSTIKRALRDLEKAGYLKTECRHRENGGQTSNLYLLR